MIKTWTDSNGKIRTAIRGELRTTTRELRALVDFSRTEMVDKLNQQIDALEKENDRLIKSIQELEEKFRRQSQLAKGTVRT